MTLLNLFLVVLAVSTIPVIFVSVRAFHRHRGPRLVTCPETRQPAAVRIDRGHAAATTLAGEPDLRMESCTRWPERQHCGQDCLSQIVASPDGCLAQNILAGWYDGAACVRCGHPIEIHRGDNKPALLSPSGRSFAWDEIRPEALPSILATHERICWGCHVDNALHGRIPDPAAERKAAPERRAL